VQTEVYELFPFAFMMLRGGHGLSSCRQVQIVAARKNHQF